MLLFTSLMAMPKFSFLVFLVYCDNLLSGKFEDITLSNI